MNKNTLSIAIIILAVAIIVINFMNSSKSDINKESAVDENDVSSFENAPGTDLSSVKEGSPAPDFELTTIEGETVKLSDYRGKKVILNFWATWCPPCKAEMPHMQNFYEENKENGIEILAVNLTNMDNGAEAIESFVKEYGLTFAIPLDQDGEMGATYQAFTIPTSYILDTKGIITRKIVGPMDENMMESLTKNID